MANRLPNYQLDYTKCTIEELRVFIKSRTDKNSTSKNVSYLAKKLRALDETASFRFMDLPAEMRLLVYSELLHRPDPDEKKTIHAQILATCKQVYREAEPELNQHANMHIEMVSNPPKSGLTCLMGAKSMQLSDYQTPGEFEVGALWPLYEVVSHVVRDVRHITVDINLRKYVHQARITPFLHALTAALRESKLRSFTVRLKSDDTRTLIHRIFWPLRRIKSEVELSMEGFPEVCKNRILEGRAAEDTRLDSIVLGKSTVRQMDDLVALLAHLDNPDVTLAANVLRAKAMKATRWTWMGLNDSQMRDTLNEIQTSIQESSMVSLIKEAKAVSKAKENSSDKM